MSYRRAVIKVPPSEISRICVPPPVPPAHIHATERVGPRGAQGEATQTIALIKTNASGAPLFAGMAVATASNGVGVVRASFADIERQAVGIAQTSAEPGAELTVVVLGLVEVEDWTAATGGAWLPPNCRLWLAADGSLTTEPTADTGEYNQSLGWVSEPNALIVLPSRPLHM